VHTPCTTRAESVVHGPCLTSFPQLPREFHARYSGISAPASGARRCRFASSRRTRCPLLSATQDSARYSRDGRICLSHHVMYTPSAGTRRWRVGVSTLATYGLSVVAIFRHALDRRTMLFSGKKAGYGGFPFLSSRLRWVPTRKINRARPCPSRAAPVPYPCHTARA
jgi:hypothetical protein